MVYANDLKCMPRLFNAIVQQLCVEERVGFEDSWGCFVERGHVDEGAPSTRDGATHFVKLSGTVTNSMGIIRNPKQMSRGISN